MLFKDKEKHDAGRREEQYIYFYYKGKIRGQFTLAADRYVYDLEIYEQYRGQGYGNIMIREMVERFTNDAQRPLWLAVEDKNAPAVHLYNKYGFSVKEKGYGLTYLVHI
jgi:ribosomal protein S18 acetylase RimI-like enzyme